MSKILTEEIFVEWVKEGLVKCPHTTPSAFTLKSFYVFEVKGIRFDRLRSLAETTKQIYLKELKNG